MTYGNVIQLGCYYMYNLDGAISIAVCEGWNNTTIQAARNGLASLVCEAGEYRTASGCVTTAIVEKRRECRNEAGNPVDTRSGMKVASAIDFMTAGDAPLKFEREYRSDTGFLFGNFDGNNRLGRGWRSNFDSSVWYDGSASSGAYAVYVMLPDGDVRRFVTSSGGYNQTYLNWSTKAWVNGSQNGEILTLVRNTTDSRYDLTTQDDTLWRYDYTGKLVTIRYRGGYTQDLAYDSNGNNTTVTDSFGRQLTFTYTAQGLLSTMTVPGGQVYNYSYTGRYDPTIYSGVYSTDYIKKKEWALEYVTFPDGTSTLTDNPKVRYHYENSSFPFALTGVTDERGVRYATWTYGTDGRVATSEHAGSVENYSFSYNDSAHTVTVTNPLSKQTIYHFSVDARGLNRLTQIEGVVSTHCAAANTSYAYDSNSFVNQTTDGEGRVTGRVNNTRGLPTSVTRASGTPAAVTTSYTWHSTLRVPTQVVEPNLTTDLTWNTSGQLTQVTQTDTSTQTVPYSTNGQTRNWAFTFTTGGLLASVDGPLSGTGDTASYIYNSSGFVQTVTNEVGHVTTFTAWDGHGLPTSVADPNGVVTSLAYDERGRLKTMTVDPTGVVAVTSIEYAGPGDITKVTYPSGAFLQYTWDNARRLIKVEDNTGASVEYDRNAFSNITARRIKNASASTLLSQTTTFDELGRLLTFVGAATQTWTQGYDKTDNLTSITDPRSNVYQYAFDGLNRLYRETNEGSAQVNLTLNGKDEATAYSDPRSLVTSYIRSGFGEVIRETSPDTGTTDIVYNALGKPTQITDGRGIVTNLTYDSAGRLLTRQYPAASAENISITWDSTTGGNKGVGRITRIDDASGSTEYTYNVLSQVTQEKKTTGPVVYTVDYTYDLAGNITQVIYPSGRIVSYSRDSLGRISGITTKKDSGSATVTLAASVIYQPFGPLASLTYGNGLVLTETVTQDYQPDALQVQDGSTVVLDRSHAFGDGINLTAITDNAIAARSESYVYTTTNRLSQAGGLWGILNWGYDSVGNRTSEALTSGSTTTWTYTYPSISNKLSSVTDGTNVRTLTHDGAGNVTADNRVGSTYNYRYNNRSRLDRLTVGTTVTADYTYDGRERLAIRATQNTTPSGTTHYVYDLAGHLISESIDTGTTLREYIWLDGLPLAVVADVDTLSPNLYFVHADHLDRPLKMTDGSQAIVWDAIYRPFGEVQSITGTASNNLRFPGQYFLIEAGLHYNWHRHYEPTLGRYLQADPLGFVDGPSVYSYAALAPTIEIDPDGQQATPFPSPGLPFPIPPGTIPGTPDNKRFTEYFINGWRGFIDACLVVFSKEHTKNARPSTEEKHEEGEARRKQDQGGEAGDSRRRPPRRRPGGWKGPWPPKS
jgi:RHS repeat-associated protein